ncbi:MAG TPA: hypothetical protein VFI25_15220 [Planctomycetota bacterium]|nr:hypothetical protein [Planctomycetota bacterium]
MNGRSLHDALLRVLTDAPLRRAVLEGSLPAEGGVGPAEADALRRSDRDRLERMARFLARHFYRERVVRLFAGTRALAARTGRDPLSAIEGPAFRAAIAGARLGSPESADAVAGLVEAALRGGEGGPTAPFPFWSDLLRYEGEFFRAEAVPRSWRAAPEPSHRPRRSPWIRILDLDWDVPAVLHALRQHAEVPSSARAPTRLLFAASPSGKVHVARCPDPLLRLLEALDGTRTVEELAPTLGAERTALETTVARLREMGAVL